MKMSINERVKILVLGYIVRAPIGGLTWHHLQYVLGLKRLGHDVCFLEDSDDYASCYDPTKHVVTTDPACGLDYIKKVFDRLGMGQCWGYYDAHTSKWFGPCSNKISEICNDADLILNISEVNPLRSWFSKVPVRVMIDTDPAFNQVRHLKDQKIRENLEKHNRFFSFAENINQNKCSIPDDKFDWIPTRQPMVLSEWSASKGPYNGNFTTVMQWDSYPPVEYDGIQYGLKSNSFEHYMTLPRHSKENLELALGTADAPRKELKENGWKIINPLEVTKDPWIYQEYIKKSKGEFSVAKHGYVICNSGWFSERSAAYLASGRPVVTQETGFSEHIPCGRGLFAFRNMDEAARAMEEINGNYEKHCRWAREIAEEYFEHRKILTELIKRSMN